MLVAVTWRAIPLLGVLFLGALRQVPPSLGRAARLDGASQLQTFRYVTLPAIAPTVVAACLLQVILTVQVFDIQFALSNDRPVAGSVLAGFQIFRTVIEEISLGYGAAQTMVLAGFIAFCLWVMWVLVLRPRGGRDDEAHDADEVSAARRPWRLRLSPRTSATPPLTSAPEREASPAHGLFSPIRSVAARLGRTAAIAAFVVFLGGPIVWILIASVQTEVNLNKGPLGISFTTFFFTAYTAALQSPDWQAAALVSITVTTGATVLALTVATLTAYPLARFRTRGGRPLLLFLL
jgi:ABC-type sugar transport system permease subunit